MPKYEIINHGYMYPDYFEGCGTAFTDYNGVVTGCGDNAKAAYEDAVEQLYNGVDKVELVDKLHLPTRPRGVRAKDKVPARCEDSYWYVSIRYSL